MRRICQVLALVALGAAACVSLDGISGGDAPDGGNVAEASADDRVNPPPPPPIDAGGDADADAAPLVVVDEGFEVIAGAACGDGWYTYQGNGSPSNGTAHSGAQSCLVCVVPAETTYTLDHDYGALPAVVGETWHAEAWVRDGSDAGATQTADIAIRVYDPDAGIYSEETHSPPISLTGTFQHISHEHTLSKPGRFNAYIVIEAPDGGGCTFVDDVLVYRVP